MHSLDKVDENIKKIGELFPNTLTEVIKGYREDGSPILENAIDFDVLRQELSNILVEGPEERYQFTWPDKKKSILLANAPIGKTLRPYRDESVDFDSTENLYIEGDNLEALKLLQETYLGKVNVIYIDPPYNTGNDFVYEDDFVQNTDEYLANSGQFDEEGNRLVPNLESNGRFHTDWLNMIYPRLRLAKDLLSDDGVIFISIDDNEVDNLVKCCREIFGGSNYIATFPWRKRTAKSDVPFGISQDYEWIIACAKSKDFIGCVKGKERRYYETPDLPNRPWRIHDLTKQTSASERPKSNFTMINPKTGEQYPANPNRTWAITIDTFQKYYDEKRIVFPGDYDFLNISKPAFRYFKEDDEKKAGKYFGTKPVSTRFPEDIGMSLDGTKEISDIFGGKVFSFPKPTMLIKFLLNASTMLNKDSVILDFFSGSSTTAHAVMQLNAEDGGNRKFIMIQIPEETDEKSAAFKEGYKNISEIGKERIRRVGKKIQKENPEVADKLDFGFRVLKVDTTNMQDVFYNPSEYSQEDLFDHEDNIKPDRTPEDLLFQVMLDLGVLLSSKIEETEIGGKKVFDVADGYLIACFDSNVNGDVITEIAKRKPYYAVFRDSSMASDSVATNFEQIFETYSPTTVRKVL
ncbi:site-specific DNA-methyltransferase [Alkalihalobacillus sp. BA299]|uniref:site-specific DNA-methyltransferase n=1 Tax=Alkalihalobacillus sp. BA299 TaxID=2815938 RepID=UPI001FFE0522|nr:site-specific DNA-methyltransferase [Alkalihalobacillus sp. BA299]